MINYFRKSIARELGIGIETLRYYEKTGLIPEPERAGNGYRVYSDDDLNVLRHIIGMKKYGFSLKEIKAILNISDNHKFSRAEVRKILSQKTKDIDSQIIELNNIKKLLLKLIKSY
jgi:DNA-binding transcriptional MerR regulator